MIEDNLIGEEHVNSSCKNTIKMNDRRLHGVHGDFSFFESVNREFGNANAANHNSNQHGSQYESINVGQINDTVSRLQGLNTSEMNRHAGIFNGPDGNPCNPFISDSYLF